MTHTWESAFAEYPMSLSHQLSIPQAEQCAKEVPEGSFAAWQNWTCCLLAMAIQQQLTM